MRAHVAGQCTGAGARGLQSNRAELDPGAASLLEHETLFGDEIPRPKQATQLSPAAHQCPRRTALRRAPSYRSAAALSTLRPRRNAASDQHGAGGSVGNLGRDRAGEMAIHRFERQQRMRGWFSSKKAATLVAVSELAKLIGRVRRRVLDAAPELDR